MYLETLTDGLELQLSEIIASWYNQIEFHLIKLDENIFGNTNRSHDPEPS